MNHQFVRVLVVAALAILGGCAATPNIPLDPAAVSYIPLDKIQWKDNPNDRYVVVLAGTGWVGSGRKYDPDSTVPMAAGTTVVHTGKGIHYDGAKQGDAILLIHGMGPATSTPAEPK